MNIAVKYRQNMKASGLQGCSRLTQTLLIQQRAVIYSCSLLLAKTACYGFCKQEEDEAGQCGKCLTISIGSFSQCPSVNIGRRQKREFWQGGSQLSPGSSGVAGDLGPAWGAAWLGSGMVLVMVGGRDIPGLLCLSHKLCLLAVVGGTDVQARYSPGFLQGSL